MNIPLKILVTDDDLVNRMILSGMLTPAGHEVIEATNGREAVEKFEQESPDLILMDVVMPVMDGYEAVRQIKRLSADRFVPVIFLTAITDEKGLAKCVDVGGDDFLTKPYNHVILMSKIRVMMRMIEQYRTIQEHQRESEKEQIAAARVYGKMIEQGSLDSSFLKHINNALSLFNGDVLLASDLPDGSVNILLGDGTGHGLPAALGAYPVIDLFYQMSPQGVDPGEMIVAINDKLKQVLPVEFFVCTVLINLSADRTEAKIWNAGLPEVIVYRVDEHHISDLIRPTILPLGIDQSSRLNFEPVVVKLAPGDRIIAYSDGITEAENKDGEMFEHDRLIEAINGERNPDQIFYTILKAVEKFTGYSEQSDDLTMVEITGGITSP
ncbi:MAG: fused response regulator/phosphatase [Chromatiales bacterium]|nr:fused response regulator/phosphatase [Chromatiales bacterium]